MQNRIQHTASRTQSHLTGPQLWRIVELISWLQQRRTFTSSDAVKAFEVSRRTVVSDIEHLRMLGVPVDYDAGKRTYYLTEPFDALPLVPLRRTEWAAFLVAQHALHALGDQTHARLLASVCEKLAEHLPETVTLEPASLSRSIRFDPGSQPRMPLIYLEEINQAITEAQVLKLTYLSNSTGQVTDREVEPYTLLSYEGRWYLIAYCRLRKGMRDFRVDRIQDLKMANQTFEVPPDFDLDAYLGPAFGMYRGDRSYAVHIRFSPYQARWIREEQWHESQMMVERADGSLDLRMQATGLSDLARWVLSYGGEAEVISPPVLRHRIAREVRRMQELYKDDTLVRPDEAEPNN